MKQETERLGKTGKVNKDDDNYSPLKLKYTFPLPTGEIRNNKLKLLY